MSLQTIEIEAFSGPTSVLIGGGNQPTIVYINQGPAGSSGSSTWGSITGTLSSQTDLQDALDLKANLASPTFTGTVSGITKSMVGLSNVDNTSDVNKPVSTAQQTALDLKANLESPTFSGIVTAPRIEGKCAGLELFSKAGQAINAGQVVYVTGASGTNVIVGLAQANTESTSSRTIGVCESTLALNATGYVITEGLMTVSISSATALVGDPIWLSGTTAGGMLFGAANKPVYPYHVVYLGVVTRKTGNTIVEIYVKVQNGFELDELSDVLITDPLANQALVRNSDKWINRALVSNDISDSSTGGNGAADAGKLVEFNTEGGVAFEAIIANSTITTTGDYATISTNGVGAYVSTFGTDAFISTSGTNASISTSGSNADIFTSGDDATISTSGLDANISTQGANATISTGGTDAYISTSGSNAYIATSGGGAYIRTEGDSATIHTNGISANIYTSGDNATIHTDGDNGIIYTGGYNATIHTNGQDGHIFTNGTSATIYTAGDGAPIYTTGYTSTIYTNGDLAHISTNGASATITTNGDNAHIYTSGSDANITTSGTYAAIYTTGSDALISTYGENANITTSGEYASIYTLGGQAHISTTDAYIQSGSTFNLFNGTHTTTLSHAPTDDRAIAFPNDTGTVALINPSSGTQTFSGAQSFSSTTRPTSSGTGTPAATSLITLADGDSRYPVFLSAVATADLDRNSTITPTADPSLALTLSAGTWAIRGVVFISETTVLNTFGARLNVSASGATASGSSYVVKAFAGVAPTSFTSVGAPKVTSLTTFPTADLGAATSRWTFEIDVLLVVASSATLDVNWAQFVSNATPTRRYKGSYLTAMKTQ